MIALTVEIAAGRLVTHDGLPSRAEVAAMTHGSGKLARGQFGLTRAQGGVVEGLREGHALWLDWPALETEEIGQLESAYRHVPIELESDWRRRARWKVVDFTGLKDAKLAQAIITMRLEQPYNSKLMKIGALRTMLASVGITASEWNIYVSCLCMEGLMIRKWTGNATNSRNVWRLPVRACCKLHSADSAVRCCGLFFSPDAQYDGQHENDMGQQAQIALLIANLGHSTDQQKARLAHVDMCAGR